MNDSAEAVREACVSAALRAHEDAGIRGLCAQGRWEAAVSAMRNLDVRGVVEGTRQRSPLIGSGPGKGQKRILEHKRHGSGAPLERR